MLQRPLPLSDCKSQSSASKPYMHDGFISYERPRDPSGTPTGASGYQHVEGGVLGEVLFVIRMDNGGNGVSTELLVGRERRSGNGSTLHDGRTYGVNSDCGGLIDAWVEPDEAIRIALNLSPGEVLQALVSPRSQPPVASRDLKTVESLFGEADTWPSALKDPSCPGIGEYELDPKSLEWTLKSLHFQLDDDGHEAAFSALVDLVPELNSGGAAFLLEDELDVLRRKLQREALRSSPTPIK